MGPTASGKTALALDWAERLDTRDRQRRFGAGLPRARHRQREAGRGDAGARAAPPGRRARAARGRIPPPTSRADALAAMQALRRGAGCRSSPAAPACTSRRCSRGLSAMPAADPRCARALAARSGDARLARAARASSRRSTRPRRRASMPTTRSASRARSKCIASPACRSAPGRRRRAARAFPFRVLSWCCARAIARCCTRASPRASTPCSRPASSTKCARCARDPRLHPDLPSMRAVGYRQAWQHLDGEIDAASSRAGDRRHAPAGQAAADLAARRGRTRAGSTPSRMPPNWRCDCLPPRRPRLSRPAAWTRPCRVAAA